MQGNERERKRCVMIRNVQPELDAVHRMLVWVSDQPLARPRVLQRQALSEGKLSATQISIAKEFYAKLADLAASSSNFMLQGA